jgi:DNA replication and repair protein RecF
MAMSGSSVAIYGKNGAGKTNILEAISLLAPGRGIRNAKSDDISRKPENLGWKVKATLKHSNQIHEIETYVDNKSLRYVRIDEKKQPQIALSKIYRMLWLSPSMDRLWLEGADGRRKFLDRMTLNFIPEHGSLSIKFQKLLRQRNRLIKDRVYDKNWYEVLEEQMAIDGVNLNKNRLFTIDRIGKSLTNLNPTFPKAKLSLTHSHDLDGSTNINDLVKALRDSRQKDMMAGRTLIGPHRVDMSAFYLNKDIAVSECSTGEQKAILISIILANAWSLTEYVGDPPILLLDEVAAHLDDDRRQELYNEIIKLKAQVFMTGTDKNLFESLNGLADEFAVIENNGLSEIIQNK